MFVKSTVCFTTGPTNPWWPFVISKLYQLKAPDCNFRGCPVTASKREDYIWLLMQSWFFFWLHSFLNKTLSRVLLPNPQNEVYSQCFSTSRSGFVASAEMSEKQWLCFSDKLRSSRGPHTVWLISGHFSPRLLWLIWRSLCGIWETVSQRALKDMLISIHWSPDKDFSVVFLDFSELMCLEIFCSLSLPGCCSFVFF